MTEISPRHSRKNQAEELPTGIDLKAERKLLYRGKKYWQERLAVKGTGTADPADQRPRMLSHSKPSGSFTI